MIKGDPEIQSSLPSNELQERPEDQGEQQLNHNNATTPTGTIKQAITKELNELIRSYVEYVKNVDL